MSLTSLRAEAARCRACPLWEHATRTVFGEGPASARMLMVGEQPGDVEDREGRPFVGPAGGVLADALAEAAIERGDVYLTNAVKHFKWKARGKRRIHQKPNAAEVAACRPWLDAELAEVAPHVLVLLGATAAQALLGSGFRVTKQRGVPVVSDLAPHVLATVHPSSILRASDDASRREAYAAFVADLKAARALLPGRANLPSNRLLLGRAHVSRRACSSPAVVTGRWQANRSQT